MHRKENKSGRHEPTNNEKVFGKGTYPLPEELKARIEAQRELERKGKGKRAAAPKAPEQAPETKEPSLVPLLIATVTMMLLAAVMVLRAFVL